VVSSRCDQASRLECHRLELEWRGLARARQRAPPIELEREKLGLQTFSARGQSHPLDPDELLGFTCRLAR
jgi:hypothetical protein